MTEKRETVERVLKGIPAVDCPHLIAARRVYGKGAAPEGRNVFRGFGMNAVISGEGEYRDAKGAVYPLGPGSVYFRCGRYAHETHWKPGTRVAEYYVCFSRLTFEHLEPLGLIRMPTPPVVKVADAEGLFAEYERWMERLGAAHPEEGPRLLRELLGWMDGLVGGKPVEAVRGPHRELVREVCRYLDAHPDVERDLPGMAAEFGVSYSLLRKAFSKEMGMSLRDYRANRRIQEARHLLETHSVAEVAEALGYADAFAFSKRFKRVTGVAPKVFQMLYFG